MCRPSVLCESIQELAGPKFFEEMGGRHDLRALLPDFMKIGKTDVELHKKRL